MKKHFILIICIMMMFVILTGCSNSENIVEVSFIAIVLENNESNLLVEPEEGSAELKSADQIMVSVKDAMILNSQDAKIAISDIESGKRVQIIYNGAIAESYPAQINKCYRVRVVD